jgi:hypothetical protein
MTTALSDHDRAAGPDGDAVGSRCLFDVYSKHGRFCIDLGNGLFKISHSRDAALPPSSNPEWALEEHGIFSQLCISENWSGNLSNGVIHLGERTSSLHGLDSTECGLLSLMRCYDPSDRSSILELFERASTECSRFCFSTTLAIGRNQRQPVFCTGESSGLEELYSGTISGVFVFPRFQVDAPLRAG